MKPRSSGLGRHGSKRAVRHFGTHVTFNNAHFALPQPGESPNSAAHSERGSLFTFYM